MAECQMDGWLRDFAEEVATRTQSEIWLVAEVHGVISWNYLTGNFVGVSQKTSQVDNILNQMDQNPTLRANFLYNIFQYYPSVCT